MQTPLPVGATFGEPTEAPATIAANGKPKFAPYDAAAFGRYTTPENYEKWASTPPKSGPTARPGEYEAWTGANSPGGAKETLKNAAETTGEAGLAFGTAMGVTAIPEAVVALHELAVRHLAGEVLPELMTNAGKEGAEIAYANAHAKLLALAPKVWQAAKLLGGVGLSAEGIRSLWKIAAMGNK
ncbi:MAG: hypothetical protein WA651_16865 [Candidatus Sulfotelmatobacter sp.]